jgi:hypothetical protein
MERAEEPGSVLDVDPYSAVPPGQPSASEALGRMREDEEER